MWLLETVRSVLRAAARLLAFNTLQVGPCGGAAALAWPATRLRRIVAARKERPTMANGNMNQIMKQAQAMQRKLAAAQEELAATEVEGVAGGGMVRVTVAGGGGEIRSIVIDPAAVDPDDVEMLADMVTAAVNEALRSAKQLEEEKLGGLTAGLGLPPGIV